MPLMSSIKRERIQIGKEELFIRQLCKRFGVASPELTERLDVLSSDQLDQLGEDFLDFTSMNDLEDWLTRHYPNGHGATSSTASIEQP